MDNPVRDAPGVVHKLTQGSPKEQEETINTYFTQMPPSSTHPAARSTSKAAGT